MFVKKYCPKTTKEVIGHKQEIEELKRFVTNYKKGSALLVFGPVGCGKTCTVYSLAKEMGYDIIELNASETRNAEAIEKQFVSAIRQGSLFGEGKIILIDDIDALTSRDRGGLAKITARIPESCFPVILTCTDPFEQKFKELRKSCKLLKFNEPTLKEISELLSNINKKESLNLSETAIANLARTCGADIRGALFDLECCAGEFSERNRERDIKDSLRIIFKSKDLKSVAHLLEDFDPNESMLWLSENLPREYWGEDLKNAYHYLSRADLFAGRIRKWQHWRFLSYIHLFLSAGVAVSKKVKSGFSGEYARPSRILKIWLSKSLNAKRRERAEQFAPILHISSKRAFKELAFMRFVE